MRNIFTALLFFISISLFSQDEKRLALVIGNANYNKGELKNPVNDARLIASTLDSLDFDVILKENLESQTDFKRAILEFGKKRSEYDVAFVYYAGHGIQLDDVNYLLPTKEEFLSEDEVELFGVSVQDIMRYLRAKTNEVNILILDACRDNPFESNWNKTRSLKGGGLAKIPPPTGSLIAFSTDSGQTAPDGDGDNSVYTVSLAKNMLLEDTSIDQVFRNVRAEVLAQTDGMQRPVEATQLTGQTFYLNPKSIDKFLGEIESLFEEKKYKETIAIIEKNSDYNNHKFLKILIDSYVISGKRKYAELLVNNLLKNEILDLNILEVFYDFFKKNEKWEDANKVISKISEIENNIVNVSRKIWVEYKSKLESDGKYSFDDYPLNEFQNNSELSNLYSRLKNIHSELKKYLKLNKEDFLGIEYLSRISLALISERGVEEFEKNIEFIELAITLASELIKIDPENADYYNFYFRSLEYLNDIDDSFFEDRNLNIEKYYSMSDIEFTFYRDNLIMKAMSFNDNYNFDIIWNYLSRATRSENKATFNLKFDDVLVYYEKLLDLDSKNVSVLEKRAEYFVKHDKLQLAESDYFKCLDLIDPIKNTYDFINVSVELSRVLKTENFSEKANELLISSIKTTNLEKLKVEDLNEDEIFMYGQIFQDVSEFYFFENDFETAQKYITLCNNLWRTQNPNLLENGFSEILDSGNFEDWKKQYGRFPVINYLVNLFGYTSSSMMMDAYVNILDNDYNEAVDIMYEAVKLNQYLGEKVHYDLINLALKTNRTIIIEKIASNIDKLIKNEREDEHDQYTQMTLFKENFKKLILEVTKDINLENKNKIKSFFSIKENQELIYTSIKENPSDNYFRFALVNQVLNLYYLYEMIDESAEIIDNILLDIEIDEVSNIEFLYKASRIKNSEDKKFEAYLILNNAIKRLVKINQENLIENYSLGFMDLGLSFNFDGVSPLKSDDILNLEKLIKE
tara:strand:+ start:37 stop:2949 length:2913 start_codon:yes stop_codon:yes gene_type:complete